VAFYSRDDGKTVRASWELMKDAYVSGLTRGVNYGSVSVDPANQGAAILFVGKKTDKTLLAIGRLTQVDGANTTIIGAGAKTVTFSVAALDCGVKSTSISPLFNGDPGVSFITDYNAAGTVSLGNTRKDNDIDIAGKKFGMFKLREGGDTLAEYYFRTVSTASGYRLGDFLPGIKVAADYVPDNDPADSPYGKKQPRYPTADGKFQFYSVRLDKETTITPRNNRFADDPFENPIKVTFNTAMTVDGSVFAFVFEVPVSPLSLLADAVGTKPGTWYIRASYDSYWLDLDEGGTTGASGYGAGGAVLISTGEVADPFGYRIKVIVPPAKYLYPYGTNPNPPPPNNTNGGNRRFNVEGMLVELQLADGSSLTPKQYIPNDQLSFEFGMKDIDVGFVIPAAIYGIQTVMVNYFHPASGVVCTDSFVIVCDNPAGQYTNIPNRNFIVVDNSVEIEHNNLQSYLYNRIQYTGKTCSTFVIILAISCDIGTSVDLQESFPNNLIIVVSGTNHDGSTNRDNGFYNGGAGSAALGRTTFTQGAFCAYGTANAFYFGLWPFNSALYGINRGGDNNTLGTRNRYSYEETIPANVNGVPSYTLHKTYPYTLNAAGPNNSTATRPGSPEIAGNPVQPITNSYFLYDAFGGQVWNVQVDESQIDATHKVVTVYNRPWFN
jgi:hypothetical protein